MAEFSIESNGTLEKTAIYYNGEQLAGIRQLMLHISENGDFDTIIVYEGTDKNLYTKNIFADYLVNVKTVEPTFTEEEAQFLRLLIVHSDGNLENTEVIIDDEPQEGITDLLVQIERGDTPAKSGFSIFKKPSESNISSPTTFRAEIQYRNYDGSLSTENIF